MGASLGQMLPERLRRPWVIVMLAAVSVIPDLDVISFRLGIPCGHPLGHRGFSHSFLFAALVGVLGAAVALRGEVFRSRRWWLLAFVIVAAVASHGILDAATDAGLGIGFLVPFDLANEARGTSFETGSSQARGQQHLDGQLDFLVSRFNHGGPLQAVARLEAC